MQMVSEAVNSHVEQTSLTSPLKVAESRIHSRISPVQFCIFQSQPDTGDECSLLSLEWNNYICAQPQFTLYKIRERVRGIKLSWLSPRLVNMLSCELPSFTFTVENSRCSARSGAGGSCHNLQVPHTTLLPWSCPVSPARQRSRSITATVPQRRAKTPSPKRGLSPTSFHRAGSQRRRSSSGCRHHGESPMLFRQRTHSVPYAVPVLSPQNKSPIRELLNRRSDTPSSDDESPPKKVYHVVVIGSENVGKASLLSSAFGVVFDENNGPGDSSYVKSHQNYNDFSLRISCDANAIQHLYKYDGLILVYSVTDGRSFSFVKEILAEARPMGLATILVGNKADLERSRVITTEDGLNLAARSGVKFIEVSCSFQVGLDSLRSGLFTQFYLRSQSPSNRSRSPSKILDRILSRFHHRKCKSCLDLHTL